MSILTYVGYGVGVVAILGVGTMLLPRHVRVERMAAVAAAPADVIAMAASNAGYQKFNPYKKADAALKIELFGPESGVGSGFKFDGKDGTGSQVVSSVGADRVDYAIDLGFMGKPNQTIAARATGAGSTITWTMNADMGFNPIGRVMGLFMDGMVGPTFENGIKNIDDALKS